MITIDSLQHTHTHALKQNSIQAKIKNQMSLIKVLIGGTYQCYFLQTSWYGTEGHLPLVRWSLLFYSLTQHPKVKQPLTTGWWDRLHSFAVIACTRSISVQLRLSQMHCGHIANPTRIPDTSSHSTARWCTLHTARRCTLHKSALRKYMWLSTPKSNHRPLVGETDCTLSQWLLATEVCNCDWVKCTVVTLRTRPGFLIHHHIPLRAGVHCTLHKVLFSLHMAATIQQRQE